MTGSVHLRGIVIAGVLAAVALALGFFTLAMNQSASQAAPKTIVPLHLRHHATATPKMAKAAKAHAPKAKPKPKPNPNYVAAVKAGLPRSVARALAKHAVVVVQITSKSDPVAQLAAGEAKTGANDANAAFVAVNVDGNGGDVEVLTRALGQLPPAPAALIYVRPAKLATTLANFNDRTVIEQAVVSATPQSMLAGDTTWATQANAICTKETAAAKAVTVTDYAGQSAVSHAMIAQLTALTPPAAEQIPVRRANALLGRAMVLGDKVRALVAAKKNPLPTLVRAETLVQKAFVTYDRLGATVCTTAT